MLDQNKKTALLMTIASLVLVVSFSYGQIAPPVGIRHNTPNVHAFTNARIVTAPGNIIEKGAMVVRDGVITAIGANAAIPADARVWDMAGMTIYPGLIDSYSDYGMPKKPQPSPGGPGGGEQQAKGQEIRGLKHWNGNVLASQNAEELFATDAKAAEKLRGIGFTTVHAVPQKGIFRGTSALFDLGDDTPNNLLEAPAIGQYITFETADGDGYPNSLMGTIALIRQTFLDAQWHKSAIDAWAKNPAEPKPEFIADLAALQSAAAKQTVIFETTDELSLLRADKIAKEFSLKWWARGSGSEYRRLDAVRKTGVPILLPVAYPETPAVQTQEEALNVSLQELRYWDEAPDNPKRLADAGITFAFTTAKLKDPGSFMGNIRKAIERGLTPDQALAALTNIPAKLFGVDKKIGSLETGKTANFVVTDGDLFSEKTKVMETWVEGKRYEVKAKPELDVRGTWAGKFSSAPVDSFTLNLKGDADKPEGSLKVKGKEAKLTNISTVNLLFTFSFNGDSIGLNDVVRMTGSVNGSSIIGSGELSDGKTIGWTAALTEAFKAPADSSKPKPPAKSSFALVYPDGEFGRPKPAEQLSSLLIKGATIWTSGPAGIIENGDLLVEKGKIVSVGQNIQAPADAVVIDGKGKQVSPGLIDSHSHTAGTGSLNETGKTITSEVRISDVIDCDDISIYRELAGGLTAANVLHGSANPIGGQAQVIKLRWGLLPEEMKFDGAFPGIKFALGENPKQGWNPAGARYPQSREGVEQIIRDEFQAARDYKKIRDEYNEGKIKIPPRRNLQTEAILEILEGKRTVRAHAYRQDEMLMLVRVADDFGFKIGSFEHVLEGYKVADVLASHGIGGSTFSDWWAYKFEVYDAIPYNGALMHDQGVVVSFNSDSDEQACRLNTEAAKAIKYGGVSPQDALKFVTLNPAKILRIDNRVGSLEPGKDADFVVWNGSPLSPYSIAEQTWIDGRKYFDRAEDLKAQKENQQERAELIQKALGSKKDEGPGGKFPPPPKKEKYSCKDELTGKESR